MIFTSLTFAIFLVIVFAVYWMLPRQSWRNVLIVGASYVFYGWWDWRFCGLMLATSLVDYVLGLALAMGGGDPADGVTHLRRAIALRPDWPEAINSLAWVLAGQPTLSPRGASEAIELASHANELTGYRVPKYLDTLAMAKRAASHRSATTTTTATTIPHPAHGPVTRRASPVP